MEFNTLLLLRKHFLTSLIDSHKKHFDPLDRSFTVGYASIKHIIFKHIDHLLCFFSLNFNQNEMKSLHPVIDALRSIVNWMNQWSRNEWNYHPGWIVAFLMISSEKVSSPRGPQRSVIEMHERKQQRISWLICRGQLIDPQLSTKQVTLWLLPFDYAWTVLSHHRSKGNTKVDSVTSLYWLCIEIDGAFFSLSSWFEFCFSHILTNVNLLDFDQSCTQADFICPAYYRSFVLTSAFCFYSLDRREKVLISRIFWRWIKREWSLLCVCDKDELFFCHSQW